MVEPTTSCAKRKSTEERVERVKSALETTDQVCLLGKIPFLFLTKRIGLSSTERIEKCIVTGVYDASGVLE